MKKRGIRRLFSVLLALVVIVGTINLPMNVKVAKADGLQQIGTSSAYWEVIDGVIYITGSGNLPDYSAISNQPWYSVRDSITSISIAPGITGLGKNNFDGLRNVTSISVPDSVTSIGQYCFHNTGIESVVINGSNITINGYAFANCKNLKNVSFSGEVHYDHDGAFYGCMNLEAVTFGSINRLGKFDFYNCTKLEKIVINNIPDGFTIDESLFGYDVAGIPANLYIVIPDGKSIADLGISDLNLRSALCGKVVTQSQYDAWKVGDEKITQRNHDFDENTVFTKIDENTHQWTCSTCGGVAQGNHDFSVKVDSTNHKCSVCGAIEAHDTNGENGSCSKCGYGYTTNVDITSMSLELDPENGAYIGVNLYVDAPDAVIFKLDGKAVELAKDYKTGKNNKIQFRCAAKEFADSHTLTAYDSNNEPVEINGSSTYVYSGEDYCKLVLSDSEKYSDKLKAVCNTLVEYNKQTRNYFGYNTDGLTVGNISATLPAEGYGLNTTGKLPEGCSYKGSSLILKDEIVLRHYFAGNISPETITCKNIADEKEMAVKISKVSSDMTCVDIAAPYSKISNMYELSIGEDAAYTLTYGVLTYCNKAYELNPGSDLVNTCNAMYNYSVAANNYFN